MKATNQPEPAGQGVQPRTTFDWLLYVDATLAGLAILFPIPLVDVFLEWLFKRRIPQAVARRNDRKLDPETLQLFRQEPWSCTGCLLAPVALVILFLKRLYRTLLYFLTVKEASDKLSHYWHQAFLIDFMVRRGDLDNADEARPAIEAMRLVLAQHETSPLNRLALQIVQGMRHVLRSIWRWRRRGQKDEALQQAHQEIEENWGRFESYLREVASQYEQTLAEVQATYALALQQLKTPE